MYFCCISDLLHLFLDRVESFLKGQIADSQEEAFRAQITLMALIQNPPGDLPEQLREDILDSFCHIFGNLRYICLKFRNSYRKLASD